MVPLAPEPAPLEDGHLPPARITWAQVAGIAVAFPLLAAILDDWVAATFVVVFLAPFVVFARRLWKISPARAVFLWTAMPLLVTAMGYFYDQDKVLLRQEATLRERLDFAAFYAWQGQPRAGQTAPWPDTTAVATKRTLLRAEPRSSARVVAEVEAGQVVNLILRSWNADSPTAPWFRGRAGTREGWIDGRTLRPQTKAERLGLFASGVDKALTLLFPEKTLLGKLLGLAGGLVLAWICSMVRLPEPLGYLLGGGVTFTYFMARGIHTHTLVREELAACFFAYVFLSGAIEMVFPAAAKPGR